MKHTTLTNPTDIALSIPDFEGQAILRIFSNATQSEIACYSAVVTNGKSFSQPVAVASTLGAFTFIALCASFLVAIYVDNVKTTRNHYAHSISVLVIFEVFQSIYFTGALSLNWPSVLPAFWSNFAWAAGMIYVSSMQQSINNFIGSNQGNISKVGAAVSGYNSDSTGGGYDIRQIFGNSLQSRSESEFELVGRSLPNASEGYTYYGPQLQAGLPLPGNYSGFAGTLSKGGEIPLSNAFLTGLIWFLVLFGAVAVLVPTFKWILEALALLNMIKKNRLDYFRSHWIGFTVIAVVRTVLIAFFALTFLSLFELSYQSSVNVTAVAAVVFIIVIVGTVSSAAYAFYYGIKIGDYVYRPNQQASESRTMLKMFPRFDSKTQTVPTVDSNGEIVADKVDAPNTAAVHSDRMSVHDDSTYMKRFGWLTARYRRSRWWFFLAWLLYQFVRACFLAGAAFHPLIQVFGLLAVEVIAFVAIVLLRPFKGQRLNTIMVYCLGFSKFTTTALAATFDVSFNLNRIIAAAIGIVIIVIQSILVLVLIISITLGAFSSYASLTRNREDFEPRKLEGWRTKYLRHVDWAALDVPREKQPLHPPSIAAEPELPREPYFNIGSVRRMSKIGDEDDEFASDFGGDPTQSDIGLDRRNRPGRSYTNNTVTSFHSNRSRNSLPYGARRGRPSWAGQSSTELIREVQSTQTGKAATFSQYDSPGHGSPQRQLTSVESHVEDTISPIAGPYESPYASQRDRGFSNVSLEGPSMLAYSIPLPTTKPRNPSAERDARESYTDAFVSQTGLSRRAGPWPGTSGVTELKELPPRGQTNYHNDINKQATIYHP